MITQQNTLCLADMEAESSADQAACPAQLVEEMVALLGKTP